MGPTAHTFELHRDVDTTGVSGTGIVAQGVEFVQFLNSSSRLQLHRTVIVQWCGEIKSVSIYPSMDEMKKVHCHGGTTRVIMTGDAYTRGMDNCHQDACENVPFSSIGGLEARQNPKAPDYITESEKQRYLAGYAACAKVMYGDDWATCHFGWSPAVTIGGKS